MNHASEISHNIELINRMPRTWPTKIAVILCIHDPYGIGVSTLSNNPQPLIRKEQIEQIKWACSVNASRQIRLTML